MKKAFYRALGVVIILLCAMSAGVYTISWLGIIGCWIFGSNVDEDVVFFSVMALPLLVFFYSTWGTSHNVDRIKKLLNYEEE